MEKHITLHELRRRAPHSFLRMAVDAHFSAFFLYNTLPSQASEHAQHLGRNEGGMKALRDAFRREATLSLELILKAVIAKRYEILFLKQEKWNQVPAHHDIVKLWSEAKLPKLSDRYMYLLIFMKQIMSWSGRYPAPKTEREYDEHAEEISQYEDIVGCVGGIPIVRPSKSFTFQEFDYLYNIAFNAYETLSAELP